MNGFKNLKQGINGTKISLTVKQQITLIHNCV
jgi:hypothetical protein